MSDSDLTAAGRARYEESSGGGVEAMYADG